jgi:methyltransferase (TIGR00027 family)
MRGPSRTAMNTAIARAWRPDPAVPPDETADVMSILLAPSDASGPSSRPKGFDALFRPPVIARQRIAEEQVRLAVERGVDQYVILGAGLDAFAHRALPWAHELRVFEIDHPQTQEWKRARIAELGWPQPSRLHYVACDFEHDDLLDRLRRSPLDLQRPVVASWLGVVYYLTREAIAATLAVLATFVPGSEITISYRQPPRLQEPAFRRALAAVRRYVAAEGEPFRALLTHEEMDELLAEAGFGRVVHHEPAEVNPRLFDHRADGIRFTTYESVVTAVCG